MYFFSKYCIVLRPYCGTVRHGSTVCRRFIATPVRIGPFGISVWSVVLVVLRPAAITSRSFLATFFLRNFGLQCLSASHSKRNDALAILFVSRLGKTLLRFVLILESHQRRVLGRTGKRSCGTYEQNSNGCCQWMTLNV